MSRDVAAKELAHAVALAGAMPRFCPKRQALEVIFVSQSRMSDAATLVDALTDISAKECAAVVAVVCASLATAALAAAGMTEQQAKATLIEIIR